MLFKVANRMSLEWERCLTSAIGTIVLLGCFVGMVSNATAIHYFLKCRKSNVFSKIFLASCSTDMLTSVLTVSVAVSYLLDRQPGTFFHPIFNGIWGCLWNFGSRYSVYIVAVMSITRTARIVFPFQVIRTNLVLASLTVFAVWLVCTTPEFYGIPHYYKKEWCALALNKSSFVKKENQGIKYYFIVLSIPIILLLNIPLVFISASMSSYKIYKIMREKKIKNKKLTMKRKKSDKKDSSVQSVITILCVVLMYLLLNIPYAVVYIHVQTVSKRDSVSVTKVIKSDMAKKYVLGITHILSISLNALLNPLVLYFRMISFKEHVNSLKFWRHFRMKAKTGITKGIRNSLALKNVDAVSSENYHVKGTISTQVT